MATASSKTENTDIDLSNIVKCAICLDYYDDPRLLPCSHTYCYQCIVKLCDNRLAQCPMRDNTYINPRTINTLPVNRTAKDLVECIQESSKKKLLSSKQNECNHCKNCLAEYFCGTCALYYCTKCLQLQHTIKDFKNHSINIFINENFSNICPEHVDSKLKYWCNCCETLVCSDCLLFRHKNHPFDALESVEDTIKTQIDLSAEKLVSREEDLEKLNDKAIEAHRYNYKQHSQTKYLIDKTINELQSLLDERKKYLINTLLTNEAIQQNNIEGQKGDIEDHLKSVLIRNLFTQQLLKTHKGFQLAKMRNDAINYNQLIEEQCKESMHGFTFEIQNFTIEDNLSQLKCQLQDLGRISTETFLVNSINIRPLLKLSEPNGKEKSQSMQGSFAYGYRFNLNMPLNLNAVQVKLAVFNAVLIVYILDNNDILVKKNILENDNEHSSALQWITIPIKFQLEHNFYIFIWAKSDEKNVPLIAYRDSTQKLRHINENVSVRSKRVHMNDSQNIDINTKFNVIYDAFLSNDELNEKAPAIEMMLDI